MFCRVGGKITVIYQCSYEVAHRPYLLIADTKPKIEKCIIESEGFKE